ncbi:hypothetical protein DFJ77DRAFT_475516 [Powellomyces hirtus]|nr:hypothetical protein DFJ77DRAFT_475516 [Powellomyces hirtus]
MTSTAPTPNLPPGWIVQFDRNYNREYYVDTATGVSHWELPQQHQTQPHNPTLQMPTPGGHTDSPPPAYDGKNTYQQQHSSTAVPLTAANASYITPNAAAPSAESNKRASQEEEDRKFALKLQQEEQQRTSLNAMPAFGGAATGSAAAATYLAHQNSSSKTGHGGMGSKIKNFLKGHASSSSSSKPHYDHNQYGPPQHAYPVQQQAYGMGGSRMGGMGGGMGRMGGLGAGVGAGALGGLALGGLMGSAVGHHHHMGGGMFDDDYGNGNIADMGDFGGGGFDGGDFGGGDFGGFD